MTINDRRKLTRVLIGKTNNQIATIVVKKLEVKANNVIKLLHTTVERYVSW